MAVDAAIGFAKANGSRFVEELKEFLRIPSISTTPERAGDVRRAAEFVADGLRQAGMENVRIIETSTAERTLVRPVQVVLRTLRKATLPSLRAKRVWSWPRPTFLPGIMAVPLWRTITLPVLTTSPA